MRHHTYAGRYPRVLPVGETAFSVEFGDCVDASLNHQVHALDAALGAHPLVGIIERIPTYRSLLIVYDPTLANPETLQKELLQLACGDLAQDPHTTGRLIEIPVRYGGRDGPDLEDVAAHCGLSATAVIEEHTAVIYQVAMLGFAPGFTYLLGLPPALATPRLATPRLHVSPGSIGIADNQTGIYALSTPGGWRIIGRTPLRLFDPSRETPFSIAAGDRVRFIIDG